MAARIIPRPAFLHPDSLLHILHTLHALLDASSDPETLQSAHLLVRTLRHQSTLADLPHGQFSTLLLLDARLAHLASPTAQSNFTTLSPYLLAFSQFVSGYCDIARVRTTGSRAGPSMYDVAASIGMPDAFVAFRHAITHQRLPGPAETLAMWHRALRWLLDEYWEPLRERVEAWAPPARSSREEAARGADAAVKAFLKRRKAEIKGGAGDGEAAAAAASAELYAVVCGAEEGEGALVDALLRKGVLVPADRDIARVQAAVESSVRIWDRLLRKLTLMLPRLGYQLLLSISVVVNTTGDDDDLTSRQQALLAWTKRILLDGDWKLTRAYHLTGVTASSLHLPDS